MAILCLLAATTGQYTLGKSPISGVSGAQKYAGAATVGSKAYFCESDLCAAAAQRPRRRCSSTLRSACSWSAASRRHHLATPPPPLPCRSLHAGHLKVGVFDTATDNFTYVSTSAVIVGEK
eukprot:5089074-Prymnesium_polylepis.2